MVIHVIAAEVGQHGDIKLTTGHAILVERMRRHFHHDIFTVADRQFEQNRLQGDGVRRGQSGHFQFIGDTVTQGANAAGLAAKPGQRLNQ